MSNSGNLNRDKLTANREPEGITEIRVGGFKSIVKPQAIEVRALTLLAGANSSGKTSFIQPLLMLKQTLEATFDPGPLKLDGPNVKFTSGDQLLSRSLGKASASGFEVGFSVGSLRHIRAVFEHEPASGFRIEQTTYRIDGKDETLRRDTILNEVPREQWPNFREGEGKLITVLDKCFLDWALKLNGDDHEFPIVPAMSSPLETIFVPRIRSIIHLPGLRGNRERVYAVAAVGPTFPGTFENYAASVIAYWQAVGDQESMGSLNRQLSDIGLNSGVTALRVTEVHVELRVARLLDHGGKGPNDSVNIADVGFGVSQTLPVLVALLVASPGQTVYIEEPEIHLHPRAQVRMAEVLAEAAQRGVRVIAETHSSLLLRAVQTLVAKGELDPTLVKLHWFTRNEQDGATEVRSADLDENGAFGDWPMDFDEVELRSEREYLDAVGFGRKR